MPPWHPCRPHGGAHLSTREHVHGPQPCSDHIWYATRALARGSYGSAPPNFARCTGWIWKMEYSPAAPVAHGWYRLSHQATLSAAGTAQSGNPAARTREAISARVSARWVGHAGVEVGTGVDAGVAVGSTVPSAARRGTCRVLSAPCTTWLAAARKIASTSESMGKFLEVMDFEG